MSNFQQAIEATNTAINSQGSAVKENSRYMESFEAKINNIKASWDELILALADSDAIKDLLDTINNGLRSLAENEKAIDTLVALAKALALFKGIQIGKNFLGGLITSGKEGIKTGKKLISVLTDIPIVLGWIKELGAKETFTTLFPKLAGQITSVGSALATVAPYAGVFLALAGAVGIASGKFAEMHNQHIAETSDDIYKVADSTLKLVSAYKEFEHGGKGKGAKQVWGQEALDALIPKLQNVQEEYEKSEISAQEFLDKIGDISPLVDYYNSLQNIIDSGGELLQTQQDNYKALSKVVGAYDSATTRVENYDKALKINKANTNISVEAATLFAQSLEQVGGKYQFVSEEAKKAASGGIGGGGTKGKGGSGGGGDGKGKKEKKDYLSIYKKRLEEYQKAQKDAYQKGEISASEYYSNVQKRGKSYYDKLKKMGSDYASDAKSMLDTYKQYNTTAVKDIFSEIEYRYKEGQIDGKKYYNELWKYVKKFYKNGKIDFDGYRDYIKKGYTALFDNLKKQYESGQLTAEQYQKKVDEAQKKSEKSIRQSVKSGALDKSMVKVTRNALVDAAYAAKNEVAKALKQAAIEAAEAAVEAAQKKLEEAQKRQDRADAFISALQFYADEQTEAIDKTIDGYNEQIEKLNEQLDLMDEQNDALDKQAERIKLVNALEEAKKQKTVRVYDSSLGWVD